MTFTSDPAPTVFSHRFYFFHFKFAVPLPMLNNRFTEIYLLLKESICDTVTFDSSIIFRCLLLSFP